MTPAFAAALALPNAPSALSAKAMAALSSIPTLASNAALAQAHAPSAHRTLSSRKHCKARRGVFSSVGFYSSEVKG